MSKLELKATFSSMSKGHLEDTLEKCHLEIQGCLFVSVYWSLRGHFKKVSFSEKNITKKDTFPRFCLALHKHHIATSPPLHSVATSDGKFKGRS